MVWLLEKGLTEKAVLKELESKLREDFTYKSGRILGSMCSEAHRFSRLVYMRNLEKNLGDPGLFPGSWKIEEEAVRMMGSLVSNPDAYGHIVSGGSEANTIAMWVARKISGKSGGDVIVPASAHFSLDKASDLLGLNLVKVRLNERFQVDVEAVREAVTSRTVTIIGAAGSTDLGVVDPIDELSELALSRNIYLHVDAAFGGFVLPLLAELGYETPRFDFSLKGVCSVTMDPHKMGLAPIPSGGLLFRDSSMLKAVGKTVSYMSGGECQLETITGTRPGASALAAWAVMKLLGRRGYREVVKRCMKLTLKLAGEVEAIDGLGVPVQPTMNIVGIKSDGIDIGEVAGELRSRGWALSLFPKHIRIVVMPHLKPKHVDRFVKDLREVAGNLRA